MRFPLAPMFVLLLVSVSPALAQETRTLTAQWVLDVERGEAIENGIIIVKGFTAKETVAAMAQRRVLQTPTLFSLKGSVQPAVYEKLRAHLTSAVRDGLPIAFGTDAGVIPHGRNAKEFIELAALGLKPVDAIRAATVGAAKAVGLADQVGVLKGGALADIIAVEGNPLNDLSALQKVKFVMKAGQPINLTTL